MIIFNNLRKTLNLLLFILIMNLKKEAVLKAASFLNILNNY